MKTILFSLLLLCTLSCTNNDDNNDFEPQTITPVLIGKDNLYGNGEEGILQKSIVISDQIAWTQMMNSMNRTNNVTKNFTTTAIDFNEYQVIAVFDNIKTTGGFSIDITNVEENQNNIVVTIKHFSDGVIAATVLTQPFNIVKISKSSKPIVFQ